MREAFRFKGFRSPNYTQVPDEFFDELLATLSLGELKVLLYVMRRTFGFKKGSDRICKCQLENGIVKSNGQVLDRGTGLSRRAIRLAVQRLIAKNILLKRTHRSARKGDESTEYALNIIGNNPWVPSTPGGGTRSTQGEGHQVPSQETVDKIFKYVNVNALQKTSEGDDEHRRDDLRTQATALAILDVCGDRHSLGSYVQIARTYPEGLIFEALSLTKDARARRLIRKSAGAYFTDAVGRLARERRLDQRGAV